MMRAVKIRLYPNREQEEAAAKKLKEANELKASYEKQLSEARTLRSHGSLVFMASAILSGGMEDEVSNTATFPRACTPLSVRLAPM